MHKYDDKDKQFKQLAKSNFIWKCTAHLHRVFNPVQGRHPFSAHPWMTWTTRQRKVSEPQVRQQPHKRGMVPLSPSGYPAVLQLQTFIRRLELQCKHFIPAAEEVGVFTRETTARYSLHHHHQERSDIIRAALYESTLWVMCREWN